MAGDDDTEKSHDPTPKKLEDARKKGEVARSVDLTTAAAYGGFFLTCIALMPFGMDRAGQIMAQMLAQADPLAAELLQGGGPARLGGMLFQIGLAFLPLFLVPALFALVAVVGQRALIFAPDKLEPKLSRISVLSNAQQKFGRAGLFEFAKSFVKLAIYSLLLGLLLVEGAAQLVALAGLEAQGIILSLFEMTRSFLGRVLVVAILIGVADYLFQSAEHLRKNRMSLKELQDEMKESEGDPYIKQQRRQKGYEIAMSNMMADVPKADVVVVNPTHYAVALKWDRLAGRAPVCVAKGVDHVALAIREKAMEHGVPLRHDPPTARALYASLDIGAEVLPEQYRPVAAAIRFAERLRKLGTAKR